MPEHNSVKVEVAIDGKQAVEKYGSGNFYLILMDCRMPILDGYDATREIRKLENIETRIPIIALTANVSIDNRELCWQAGTDDVITKPFKKDDLLNCIKKWISHDKTSPWDDQDG